MLSHVERHARLVTSIAELQTRAVLQQPKRQIGAWLCQRISTLGPTYIKMGQFISTRSDIFEKEFTQPFSALRDKVEPMTKAELQKQLETFVDLRKLMIEFDETPIASASIAQVHRARLRNGKEIAVKVRRPHINEIVKHDLSFLRSVLDSLLLVARPGPKSTSAGHLREFLHDFEASITDELDFTKEMANIDAFHSAYDGKDNVRIPRVFKGLSTNDVLVMEYMPSDDVYSYKGDKRALAEKLMNFFVGQLLYKGVVHGDPHPGNLGINKDNNIVIYDLGNTIYISPNERQQLKDLIYQLLLGNKEMIANTLEALNMEVTDRKALFKYIDIYINYMKTIDFKALNASLQSMARTSDNMEPPIKFPNKYVRLFRTYGIMEGICKELHPGFNYFDLFDTYIDGIFLDDEFLLYKAAADTNKLLSNFFKQNKID